MGWILKLFGGYKMILIAIAAASLLATVTLYVHGAEKAKGKVNTLEAANQNQALIMRAQNDEITGLTQRIRDNNTRLLEQIAAEEARTEKARQSAIALRADRDRITAELGASRARWNEAIQNDETLQAWLPNITPEPVWARLCHATGQCTD